MKRAEKILSGGLPQPDEAIQPRLVGLARFAQLGPVAVRGIPELADSEDMLAVQ